MTARLHLQLDSRSGVPVYRQMMDQIRYYVAGGTLRPGDQLPSIRELAGALAVNPTTVVKAYTELEREGVIEMRHGKGAFITLSPQAMSLEQRELALRRTARQLAVESSQLGIGTTETLQMLREELAEIHPDQNTSEDPPIKFRVLSSGS